MESSDDDGVTGELNAETASIKKAVAEDAPAFFIDNPVATARGSDLWHKCLNLQVASIG